MNNDISLAINKFRKQYLYGIESVSYVALIPLLFIYIWTNLGIDFEGFILLSKCTIIAALFSMVTTQLSNLIIIKPIINYFRLERIRGEFQRKEYIRAQKRFFYLPYINAIAALIRWVVGLLTGLVPFIMLSDLTRVQMMNIWIVIIVIPPCSMVLYFFLTEILS